jgi:hypothetical protein
MSYSWRSPQFNGQKIFDSLDAAGLPFNQGCLVVPGFSQIRQPIHFEGEAGNYTLFHGYDDTPWVFDGHISATSLSAFESIIDGIDAAINSADSGSGTYHTLIDSYGFSYANAQVCTRTFVTPPHVTMEGAVTDGNFTPGYVVQIRVTGIIQGRPEFGGSSSSAG